MSKGSCEGSKVGARTGIRRTGVQEEPRGINGIPEVSKAGVRLGPCHHGSQKGPDLSFRPQGDAEGFQSGSPERISFVLKTEQSRSITLCHTWGRCPERHLVWSSRVRSWVLVSLHQARTSCLQTTTSSQECGE